MPVTGLGDKLLLGAGCAVRGLFDGWRWSEAFPPSPLEVLLDFPRWPVAQCGLAVVLGGFQILHIAFPVVMGSGEISKSRSFWMKLAYFLLIEGFRDASPLTLSPEQRRALAHVCFEVLRYL